MGFTAAMRALPDSLHTDARSKLLPSPFRFAILPFYAIFLPKTVLTQNNIYATFSRAMLPTLLKENLEFRCNESQITSEKNSVYKYSLNMLYRF